MMSKLFSQKKVVVPFDFSADSEAAVQKVLEWSDESTEVFVVSVLTPSDAIPAQIGTMMELLDDEKRVEAALSDVRARFTDPRIHVEVRAGNPATEIVEFIDRVAADLVVMPTHGRSGIRRLTMGSVAERVVRLAKCTVLILRGHDLASAS